ncbi:hypothetical protein [Mycolicibacterium sp. HS_4_1]
MTGRRTYILLAVVTALAAGAITWVFVARQHEREQIGVTEADLSYLRRYVESKQLSMPELLNSMTCGPLREQLAKTPADQFHQSQIVRNQLIQKAQIDSVFVSQRSADKTVAQVEITRVYMLGESSTKKVNWTVTFNTANHPWQICNVQDHTPDGDRIVGWSVG